MFPLLIDPTAQETQPLHEGEAEPEFSSSLPPQVDPSHIRPRMKSVQLLLCLVVTCGAQKPSRWDAKLEVTNGKTCSNLTQVLDNWKFAIITQVKDLLVHDHASVLPEYNRIRPLSDAVGDLYRQFNTLKDDLAKLTSKFDGVEAFVDDLKHGRVSVRQRPAQRLLPDVGLRSPLRAQMRSPVRGIMKRPALITRRRGPPNMRSKGV